MISKTLLDELRIDYFVALTLQGGGQLSGYVSEDYDETTGVLFNGPDNDQYMHFYEKQQVVAVAVISR